MILDWYWIFSYQVSSAAPNYEQSSTDEESKKLSKAICCLLHHFVEFLIGRKLEQPINITVILYLILVGRVDNPDILTTSHHRVHRQLA